jgi:(p)ppGpp synthase/HD superfamily hydrolase
MQIDFSMGRVEAEAAEKVSSMMTYSDQPECRLRELCAASLAPSELPQIEKTIRFARSLKSQNAAHPSVRAYFSHPLRVATLALRLQTEPSSEIVQMGLLHNVFEVSGLDEGNLLKEGHTRRTADGIRLLTIDRQRQYDPGYLETFYRKIETFGEDLALIKCVDRVDNLLAFQLFERTKAIEDYLDLTIQFVVPMAGRLSSQFGDYLLEVITYMRGAGCDRELKSRYESFMKEAAEAAG